MQHKLIDGRVARGLCTLFCLFQQLTFDLDLLRRHSSASIYSDELVIEHVSGWVKTPNVPSYRPAGEFQIARRWWARCRSKRGWRRRLIGCSAAPPEPACSPCNGRRSMGWCCSQKYPQGNCQEWFAIRRDNHGCTPPA